MAKKTYSQLLKNPRWQKKRLEVLQRDEFKCLICGDTETQLQVHHTKYAGKPWEVDSEHLKTLCIHCHCEVEDHIKNCKIHGFRAPEFKDILGTVSVTKYIAETFAVIIFKNNFSNLVKINYHKNEGDYFQPAYYFGKKTRIYNSK